MIKDVMVRLSGTEADETRLATVNGLVDRFEGQIIGLYFNVLPIYIPEEADTVGARRVTDLMEKARQVGDTVEATVRQRLARLQKPVELRRFDVLSDAVAEIAAREARTADVFVGLRPNGPASEPENLLENVLFGSGRHLLLVPSDRASRAAFDNILIAWNGTREAARSVGESLPYLHKAKSVAVVVVQDESDQTDTLGKNTLKHLQHHGIKATLHHVKDRGGVSQTLIEEAGSRNSDLIVMGGYGHSRLREWFLGGVTYDMMHRSPVAVVLAH